MMCGTAPRMTARKVCRSTHWKMQTGAEAEVHGEFDRREAMEQVIDSCIRDGFLTEFLSVKENREAITMAEIWEYDEEAARRAAEAEMEEMREAIKLAQKESYDQGLESGEARLSALISRLIDEHRMEDVAAAVKDPARRAELYREYPDIT